MNESQIAVRYAKALFLAATEEDLEKAVMDNLKEITKAVEIPELKVFLQSPVVKKSQKMSMFSSLFEGHINALTMDFLKLLTKHNRENFIVRITRHYKKLYNEKNGIREADISFPVKINNELREELLRLLKEIFESEISLQEHIKPEIIGGFIIKIDDEQYDASVRNSLKRIKKALSYN